MARQDNLRLEFLSTNYGGVKVLDLKPQQDSISMSQFRIPNGAVMMIDVPAVQLQEQLAMRHQLLVLASAMAALASQEPLVPATARFNISNTNEGLWSHLQLKDNSRTAFSRIWHR